MKEKKRKKRVQSSIVQELRNEYLDLPEEVNVGHVMYHMTTSYLTSCFTGCWPWLQKSSGDQGGERERTVRQNFVVENFFPIFCTFRFEEANFMRLPKKRKGQSSRQMGGANDVLDDLDFGGNPSTTGQPGSRGGRRRGTSAAHRKKHGRGIIICFGLSSKTIFLLHIFITGSKSKRRYRYK